MNETFTRSDRRNVRKNLRNNMSPVEVILWSRLKGRALSGYKFRRQHSIGPYVVDFYCAEAKLAIEIDGAQHVENEYAVDCDTRRQREIEKYGVRFLRFTGKEVGENLVEVLEKIIMALAEIKADS